MIWNDHECPILIVLHVSPSFPTEVAQNNLEGLILPLSTADMNLIQKEDKSGDSCAISPTAFLFKYYGNLTL